MTTESLARDYCRVMRLDPDKKVWGQVSRNERLLLSRWMWYIGARV